MGINPETLRSWVRAAGVSRPWERWVQEPSPPPTPLEAENAALRKKVRELEERPREKASVRQIAAELGRSPSTVSREIRRSRTDGTRSLWHYRPHASQARTDARRPRPKPEKIRQNSELRTFIQDRLDLWWSPEQICQALRARFPDRPEMYVVHKTVYQALYAQGRGELCRELATALRTGRVRRKARSLAQQRRPRFRDPMVMISERPAEVEDLATPGRWEGDLIVVPARDSYRATTSALTPAGSSS